MKVTLEENYKNYYTLADPERAKAVIAFEKTNDEETPAGWAKYAVEEALKGTDDWLVRVIEASAETCTNNRALNCYTADSGNMDVWIKAIAKTHEGFIEVGACLSDIWQTGPDYSYRTHMWAVRYVSI